jgi:hypothetical protein
VLVCFEYIFELRESLLHNMDEDGEAAAEQDLVAEQNDEVLVEATDEEPCQASIRRPLKILVTLYRAMCKLVCNLDCNPDCQES